MYLYADQVQNEVERWVVFPGTMQPWKYLKQWVENLNNLPLHLYPRLSGLLLLSKIFSISNVEYTRCNALLPSSLTPLFLNLLSDSPLSAMHQKNKKSRPWRSTLVCPGQNSNLQPSAPQAGTLSNWATGACCISAQNIPHFRLIVKETSLRYSVLNNFKKIDYSFFWKRPKSISPFQRGIRLQ